MSKRNNRLEARRGVTLVGALVCLAVISAMSGVILQSIVASSRQTRRQQQRHQSMWLAQSALDRARAKLRLSDDYRGETWRVAVDDSTSTTDAVVVIQVFALPDAPNRRRVVVEARYPDDPLWGTPTEKETLLTIEPTPSEDRP